MPNDKNNCQWYFLIVDRRVGDADTTRTRREHDANTTRTRREHDANTTRDGRNGQPYWQVESSSIQLAHVGKHPAQ